MYFFQSAISEQLHFYDDNLL